MDLLARLAAWANANEGLLQAVAMLGGISALLVSLFRRRSAEVASVRAQVPVRTRLLMRPLDDDTASRLAVALERFGGRVETAPGRLLGDFPDADDAARAALAAQEAISDETRAQTALFLDEASSALEAPEELRGAVFATAAIRQALLDAPDLSAQSRGSGAFPFVVRAGAEPQSRGSWIRWALPVAGAVLLAIGLATWLQAMGSGGDEPIRSIAVLPFENLSSDSEQGYLADGVTIALIGELSKVHELRVISRTSVMPFKERPQPLSEIAARLDVDAVIEGSVIRADGQVRIDSRLIRVRGERTLWSRSYERDFVDILALQREIAESVSGAVAVNVTVAAPESPPDRSPELDEQTMRRFLRANVWLDDRTPDSIEQAIREYARILRENPEFGPGYARLIEAYIVAINYGGNVEEIRERVRSIAQLVVELEPNLAEAHLALALVGDPCRFDRNEELKHLERALELNPNSSLARGWYGYTKIVVGEFDEGIRHSEHAVRLDPLSRANRVALGIRHFQLREFDKAERLFRSLLDESPDYPQALRWLGRTWLEQGRIEDGIRSIRNAMETSERPSDHAILAYARARQGRFEEARAMLARLETLPIAEQPNPWFAGRAWAALGEEERAFEAIAEARRRCYFTNAVFDRAFDGLRDKPRFQQALREFGIDAANEARWRRVTQRPSQPD